MTLLGVDVSRYQLEPLPWPAWRAAGLAVVVIQVSHGLDPEPQAREHLAAAVAAGIPTIGAYHFLTPGDGGAQAAAFLLSLRPQHRFAALDVEQAGVTAGDVLAWLAVFKDALPLVLYGNYSLLVGILNERPELKRYPIWWSQYPGFTPPADLRVVGHQYAGNDGRLAPYEGAIDLTLWKDTFGTDIGAAFSPDPPAVHLPLGPHHAAGGMETGKWLALEPQVAKFIDSDLGASVEAHPVTLTVGRANDLGKLAGQGFDANRYVAQGVTPDAALALYKPFLLPFIQSNPKVLCWEGPNEQVLIDGAAVEWYGEFSYLFAAWLHTLGKRAAVGSWASGFSLPPNPVLWLSWQRGLQASRDFGALQAYHSYSDDPTLPQTMSNQAGWANVNYPDCTHLISELGVNEHGGGWKTLYGSMDVYWDKTLKPFLDAIYRLPFRVLACLYTDGGTSQWAGLDVSGTNIVAKLAAYAPPEDVAMPITTAQKSALLNQANTLLAGINALVVDDAPPVTAKHTLAGWTNQQVINLFYGAFKGYTELGQAVTMPNPLTTAWRGQPYAGPAIEDMSLTSAQKQQLIAALPAG